MGAGPWVRQGQPRDTLEATPAKLLVSGCRGADVPPLPGHHRLRNSCSPDVLGIPPRAGVSFLRAKCPPCFPPKLFLSVSQLRASLPHAPHTFICFSLRAGYQSVNAVGRDAAARDARGAEGPRWGGGRAERADWRACQGPSGPALSTGWWRCHTGVTACQQARGATLSVSVTADPFWALVSSAHGPA